jgi:hypothetical protein
MDRRIKNALETGGYFAGGGGGGVGGMSEDDSRRLTAIENEVHAIKGALDWAKIAFSILTAVVIGVAGLVYSLGSKIDAITGKIADEFRAQRVEQVGQVTAISNAITATKQQVPQVIVVPTGALAPTAAPASEKPADAK